MRSYKLAGFTALFLLSTAAMAAGYTSRGRFQAESDAAYEEANAIMGVSPRSATVPDLFFYIPAQLGGVAFTAVGNVIAWPCTITWGVARGKFEIDTFVPPNEWSEKYFGIPGAYLVGGPFWCLKKALWDGPIWLFTPSESTPEIDMSRDTGDTSAADAAPEL